MHARAQAIRTAEDGSKTFVKLGANSPFTQQVYTIPP